MKKLIVISVLFLYSFISYADYTGSVTTNANELKFSTKNSYNVVTITDGYYTKVVGAPQLPVKILRFVIPIDKKVSNVIVNSTSIQQLSGTYNIYPVQTPQKINITALPPFDNPNPQIYNSTTPYPDNLIEILDDEYPMGYHVVSLIFYPLKYIPASKILKLYTNINFTIVYANNTDNVIVPNRQSQLSYDLSKGYVKSIISNTNDLNIISGGAREVINNSNNLNLNLKSMSPANISFIPDYVIITDAAFVSSFQTLANWKTQKGVYTIVVSTADIYNNYQGCDNAEKIRNYLKDVYLNFGCKYILLGGDIEYVPARIAYTRYDNVSQSNVYSETDYYYATVQGNWNANGNSFFGEASELSNPEMSLVFFVGRAPVQNINQVNNFVNKVISYERMNNPTINTNYLKNLSFWAGDNGGRANPMVGLNTIDNSINGYINPAIFPVLKLYDKSNIHIGEIQYSNRYFDLNRTRALNSLSIGWQTFGQNYGKIHLFYHCDHSGPDAMNTSTFDAQERIYNPDMDALSNGSSYQIFYSDGCHPNQFSYNSISEHYINNINGGGVAFIGNTDVGWWGDDYYFKLFCKTLYDKTRTDAFENKNYHIGFANQQTVLNDPFRKKNRNILGDPEMPIWTDAPKTLTITNTTLANKQITVNVSGIDIVNAPNNKVVVTICIYKANEIYQIQEILATANSISKIFSNVAPDTPGDIFITVTAHNYFPQIISIPVTINGSHPYMTSLQINDDNIAPSQANNDAQADAGETIKLPITLTNSGNAVASNITATLTWQPKNYQSNNMITIINASSFFWYYHSVSYRGFFYFATFFLHSLFGECIFAASFAKSFLYCADDDSSYNVQNLKVGKILCFINIRRV